ncbi:hypothetical protein LO771_16070 [Streptacidiphilus sp. ASG 303]|uniref:hypothetical protein n=1 Tax=Streptacidiphilus sp. ASG 303 TaxID=2896847 RepID=UPI001E615937|nr:hypothetical protein [Streptacidiphilus sp. ASG 303]MCD0483871.1 hypothetical protein [Streptacidiphilus sp. ASG 303]
MGTSSIRTGAAAAGIGPGDGRRPPDVPGGRSGPGVSAPGSRARYRRAAAPCRCAARLPYVTDRAEETP